MNLEQSLHITWRMNHDNFGGPLTFNHTPADNKPQPAISKNPLSKTHFKIVDQVPLNLKINANTEIMTIITTARLHNI